MKKRLFVVAIFCSAFVFAGSSIALALNQDQTESNTTTKPSTTTSAEENAKLKQRIDERKNRLKIRLDSNQIKRLTLRCGGAQGKLNSQIVRFINSDNPYRAKYDNYLQRLEKLEATLKQNNIDAAKLTDEIVVLKKKIQTLKDAVDHFVTSVNDAKAIDCKGDPAGFRAALEDAKAHGLALKAARLDLEKYARQTIKATIQELKAQRKSSQGQGQ